MQSLSDKIEKMHDHFFDTFYYLSNESEIDKVSEELKETVSFFITNYKEELSELKEQDLKIINVLELVKKDLLKQIKKFDINFEQKKIKIYTFDGKEYDRELINIYDFLKKFNISNPNNKYWTFLIGYYQLEDNFEIIQLFNALQLV